MAPAWGSAQNSDQYRGEGYLFIGEGLLSADSAHFGITHVGGGGKVWLSKGLGVDGELGAMGKPASGVGLFSVGPSYNLLHFSFQSRVVPFVDAGYTRAFGARNYTRSANLANFGCGINYWLFRRVGLRLDFRDDVDHGPRAVGHYPALRIGLAVR